MIYKHFCVYVYVKYLIRNCYIIILVDIYVKNGNKYHNIKFYREIKTRIDKNKNWHHPLRFKGLCVYFLHGLCFPGDIIHTSEITLIFLINKQIQTQQGIQNP